MNEDIDTPSRPTHGNDNPRGPVAARAADLLMGLRFFSVLPLDRWLEKPFPHRIPSLNKMAPMLPLASLIIGLPAIVTLFFLSLLQLPFGFSVVLTLIVQVVTTGAMSEDAFADTADGLGGFEHERIIEIMRDPRHGTYGVLAIVLLLLTRATGLWGMAEESLWRTIPAFLAIQILSRQLSLLVPYMMPPATDSGAGKSAGILDKLPMLIGGCFAILLAAILCLGAGGIASIVFGVAICIGAIIVFVRFQNKRIGGFTGDLIGAAQAISEILLFVTFLLFF